MTPAQSNLIIGLTALLASLASNTSLAKPRNMFPLKPKELEVHTIRGISGAASFTVQPGVKLPPQMTSWQFQNGKLSEDIDFFRSPRCYLHFKKSAQAVNELQTGQVLNVSKIDNVYNNGSVHVTFWFDEHPALSNMSCITNLGHTLTVNELKATLGTLFTVSLTKSVETGALFNTAPPKNSKVLSEGSAADQDTTSARIVLSGS